MVRSLEIEDYNRIVSVVDPRLSPQGDKVAFVTLRVDETADEYTSNIWVMDLEGDTLLFTQGRHDLHPRWSPDGRKLLFLSRRFYKPGERGSELWILSVSGGESRLLLRRKEGISAPQWSPRGDRVLFLSPVVEKVEEEVRVIDRIPIWFDGRGFTYNLRRHLFSADVLSGNYGQLTSGKMDVLYAAFSHKGDKIAFVARTLELNPMITDLFLLTEGEEPVKLTESKMSIGPIAWSPDDEWILFRGSDLSHGGATHRIIWCLSVKDRTLKNLTGALDRQSNRSIYYDAQGPYAVDPQPVWVGEYIYFPLQEGGRFNLYRRTLESGEPEPVVTGDFIITAFSVVGEVVVYTKVEATRPAEVYLMEGGRKRRLTRFNDALLREVRLAKPEAFTFKASDGKTIDAWLLKPHSVEGKCPLILNIHGGPKSAWGYSFMFENQILAARGYAVLYVNSRGSGGYSQEFADIRRHYGERDYQDLMEAVDYVLREKDFIDPDRLGVTGISYGGFMTNWIVGHTNRFKAAVSVEGISSWIAEYGTTDIGFYFCPDQIGGTPWSNVEAYIEKSPLTYADRVETPILFIHTLEDYRCWFDQALSFYTALKAQGKEARLLLFMKGSHTFGWRGKPSHRIRKLEHTLEWFDKYLKPSD